MGDVAVLIWSGVIGVVSSVIASTVFLLGVARRPKLDISYKIAKSTDAEGNRYYAAKIVNRTRSPLTDVRLRMSLLSPMPIEGGVVYDVKDLMLRTPDLLEIGAFDPRDLDASYAVRIALADDLDELWSQHYLQRVRFQVHATDSFTGYRKLFTQQYFVKELSLREGEFESGESLQVI